jgi:hypothetical protein
MFLGLVISVIPRKSVIFGEKSVGVEGLYSEQIDLSNYSNGIYNLSIKISNGISNHKLILQ